MYMSTTFFCILAVFSHLSISCHHVASQDHTSSAPVRRYAPVPQSKTAITNVRVFNGSCFTPPTTIIFDKGIIITNDRNITTTINATGHFLIPGLIDNHIHINDIVGLENATSWGMTTAMNMACHNYSSCATLKHHPGLASILTAGNPAVGPNSSHAGTQPLSGLVTDASNATALASWAVGNGSDYFKITLEVNGPSYNLTRRLVRAVHDLGQKAMSHASEVNSYTQASETGIDGIQHTAQDGLLSAAVIQRIKLNKQFVTPTLTIHSFGLNPPNLAVLTAIKGNPDPGNWSWADVVSNARAMYQAGIPLITGTDAVGPLAPGLSVPFGKTLHEELWHFVDDVGMSPAEAVDAATRVAARHHELRDRGVIRTGMRADLVLLGSDPLVDIRNTMDIRGVWVEGRRFSGDLRIRA